MPNFEGNEDFIGEHMKQVFDFWGTGEEASLFHGNKGTGTPSGKASSRCLGSTAVTFRV